MIPQPGALSFMLVSCACIGLGVVLGRWLHL